MKHRWMQRVWLLCLNLAIRLRRRTDDAAAGHTQVRDWTYSTSRLGLRFTERLRDLWRPRWLKLHQRKEES